ncbi:MAG: DUF1573 domain-containing protein [Alistipes sp.]|nr:DUF1573 domain-containing protein [Alistipes sp.]
MVARKRITSLAIVAIALLAISCGGKTTTTKSTELPYQGIEATIRTDSVTEVLVELGDVRYSELATKSIRLHNPTETPLSLLDYKATCRCTWINLPKSPIPAGEYGEAELVFDSRGERGSVGNYIDITTSDPRCHIGVWISAKVKP